MSVVSILPTSPSAKAGENPNPLTAIGRFITFQNVLQCETNQLPAGNQAGDAVNRQRVMHVVGLYAAQ
jgi:hypothetical protein